MKINTSIHILLLFLTLGIGRALVPMPQFQVYAQETLMCESIMSVAPVEDKETVLAVEPQTQELPTPSPIPTSRPTPIPTATPTPTSQPVITTSNFDALFDKYSAEYGVSNTTLKIISNCESGNNPGALSSNGLYAGLFQFASTTWQSNRRAMGLDTNPNLRFNPEESIRTAAFKISRDGVGAWPTCGKKAVAVQ